jgi:hypothetical protein
MQTSKSLPELIDAARAGGHSTKELARIAGCSRMHLWRLYAGKVPESSASGRRLREALDHDDLSPLMDSVLVSVRRLVAADPQRAKDVLAMLHSVTSLAISSAD